MRTKSKLITWTVALTAAAALVTAGTVYASSGTTQVSVKAAKSLDSAALRNLLVPANQQVAGSDVKESISLQEAAAQGLLTGAPDTFSFKPGVCLTYLEDALGDLSKFQGWMQYGTRPHIATSKKYADGLFVSAVIRVPGGVNIGKIRATAAQCKTGTLTLSNTVTGTLTYTENQKLALKNADTFGMTTSVYFPKAKDAATKAVLDANGYLEEAACEEQALYAGVGDLLIYTLEPSAELATQMTATVHSKALDALGLS